MTEPYLSWTPKRNPSGPHPRLRIDGKGAAVLHQTERTQAPLEPALYFNPSRHGKPRRADDSRRWKIEDCKCQHPAQHPNHPTTPLSSPPSEPTAITAMVKPRKRCWIWRPSNPASWDLIPRGNTLAFRSRTGPVSMPSKPGKTIRCIATRSTEQKTGTRHSECGCVAWSVNTASIIHPATDPIDLLTAASLA
jgi:hypothetical protein